MHFGLLLELDRLLVNNLTNETEAAVDLFRFLYATAKHRHYQCAAACWI